ncbi:MAG: hypothetical protein ACE5ID_06330, partial [Acidobacteriota bacterium]
DALAAVAGTGETTALKLSEAAVERLQQLYDAEQIQYNAEDQARLDAEEEARRQADEEARLAVEQLENTGFGSQEDTSSQTPGGEGSEAAAAGETAPLQPGSVPAKELASGSTAGLPDTPSESDPPRGEG